MILCPAVHLHHLVRQLLRSGSYAAVIRKEDGLAVGRSARHNTDTKPRRHHGRDIEESQGGGQQLVEGAVQAVGVIVSIFPDADDGRQPRLEAGAWPAVLEDLSRKVWELVIPIFDGCPVIHEVGYDEGACSSSVRRVPTRRALKGD